jgi:hypothetical protein
LDEMNCKFFVIGGVFDEPAGAAVLNMIGSNGFYGCLKCIQLGCTIKTEKGIKLLNAVFNYL